MITLNTTLPPVILLSQLNDLIATTDQSSALVEVGESEEDVVFSQRLYASGGRITLHDFRGLVESMMDDMRIMQLYVAVTVPSGATAATVAASTIVVYCSRDLPLSYSGNFFQRQLLVPTADIVRLPPGADGHVLAMLVGEMPNRRTTYVARRRSSGRIFHGELSTEPEGSEPPAWDLFDYSVESANLLTAISEREGAPAADIEVLSVTRNLGERSATFVFDESLGSARRFRFRNIFNCYEEIWLPGVVTENTKVSRSTARTYSRSFFYNNRPDFSTQLTTDGIPRMDADRAAQLCESTDVWIWQESHPEVSSASCWQPILITDFKCELSDSDEQLNTLKITWQHAANRRLLDAQDDHDIFDSTFTPEFR